MTGFTGIKDCGNSSRKILLHDFYKAIYRGETGYLQDLLHEQFRWDFPGISFENDKAAALKHLATFHAPKISQLSISKMITHGPEAAVTGFVLSESGFEYRFCDIFTFVSAGSSLIKSISSFQQ